MPGSPGDPVSPFSPSEPLNPGCPGVPKSPFLPFGPTGPAEARRQSKIILTLAHWNRLNLDSGHGTFFPSLHSPFLSEMCFLSLS